MALQWIYGLNDENGLIVTSREPLNLKIMAEPFNNGSSHLVYFALDAQGNKLVAKRQLYEPASARSGVRDFQVCSTPVVCCQTLWELYLLHCGKRVCITARMKIVYGPDIYSMNNQLILDGYKG